MKPKVIMKMTSKRKIVLKNGWKLIKMSKDSNKLEKKPDR